MSEPKLEPLDFEPVDIDWDGLNEEQVKFLRLYREDGGSNRTMRILRIRKCTMDQWRKKPEFLQAYNDIKEEVIQKLECEARSRAMAGPRDRGSAVLLIFQLKALRPDVYRDDKNNHVHINMNGLTGADLDARILELVRKAGIDVPAYGAPNPS